MDPVIQPFVQHVRDGKKPTTAEVGPTPLLKQFHHLILKDGVLYRQVIINDDCKTQLVLPSAHVDTVLQSLHNDMAIQVKIRPYFTQRQILLARDG